MLSLWAIALVVPAAFVAVVDWRKGMLALLVVAFLQDPARKLEPGQPVYFTLLVGVVFAVVYVRAQLNAWFWPTQIPGWSHYLKWPSIIFVLLLVAQAGNSIVRYGNPVIAGIGALSYLAPLPALLVGYYFAIRGGAPGIHRWLAWYVVGALVMLSSVVVQFAGVEWDTLGQVGEGFVMYSTSETGDAILTAHSGFFRSAETAAWHTVTTVCLLILLSSMRKLSTNQVIVAVALVMALLTIGVLTGRRKLFVEIAIFLSTYVSLLLLFGKGGLRLSALVFIGGMLAYGAAAWFMMDDPATITAMDAGRFEGYAARSASVTFDIFDRFLGLGLAPVQWAIDDYGWFGGGLGVASQGAQHFGGGGEVFGGAGEGGLGKITAELGVPGLLVAIWLGVSALRYGWAILKVVSQRSAVVARLAYGLAALLLANIAVFVVATQVFGDLFAQLVLGLIAGFFLATPALALREQAEHVVSRSATNSPRPAAAMRAGIARPARRL